MTLCFVHIEKFEISGHHTLLSSFLPSSNKHDVPVCISCAESDVPCCCCTVANLLPFCYIQYVVEARYTGEEHEAAGATQQHVVGHKERYISGLPVNYGNRDLYM